MVFSSAFFFFLQNEKNTLKIVSYKNKYRESTRYKGAVSDTKQEEQPQRRVHKVQKRENEITQLNTRVIEIS